MKKSRISIFTVKLVKEKGGLYNTSAVIRSPEDAYRVINEVLDLENKTKEHFVIITLTTKNRIAGVHTIHIGTLNASVVHPREVFQQAILNNASSIMCFHNHPSGDPTPSQEDIQVTKRLKEAGDILGINVLDHIIIGDNCYKSLREMGYLY